MLGIILALVLAGAAIFLIKGDYVQGLMRPAYDTSKCYDSDGGKTYDTKGTTYGKMGTRDKQTQYTDSCNGDILTEYYCEGNIVKKEEKTCYECKNGISQKENLDDAIDTLVIVNTDEYQTTEAEVEERFNIAETYWLFPKTGIEFNILKIEFFSFSEKSPDTTDPYGIRKMLDNYFHVESHPLPEYIVIFNNDGAAGMQGGYAGSYQIYWLDPICSTPDYCSGGLYEPESTQKYCKEFKSDGSYPYTIPFATVDLENKFAACGYNDNKTEIVSGTGKCAGEETPCIMKNGYQMCENMQDRFYAQNLLNFPAGIIVHELLHSFSDDPIEIQHYGTLCAEKLGWDLQNYTIEDFSEAWTNPPFKNLGEEYAGMCPYTFQQFKNSQQTCPK